MGGGVHYDHAPHPDAGKGGVYAPKGYGYVKDRGTMLMRLRGNTEQVRDALLAMFKRLGFKPKTCKVIEVRREGAEPNERGAFYLNIGYLRGLDPDEVWRLLHSTRLAAAGPSSDGLNGAGKMVRCFSDQCGQRKVFEALARLEQRVERPPALMTTTTL